MIELSVILPCQNEEESLEHCIRTIRDVCKKHSIREEIIVSDSSSDASPKIAKRLGATLIKHDQNGYGRAYLHAFPHVKGTYIFCADPDSSYDFKEIPRFINYLRDNYDMVIGNRFSGNIQDKAMPLLHQYVGNPLLTFMARMLFNVPVHDTQSGMRGIRTDALMSLGLTHPGMEFASEMIIKATQHGLRIKEVPISYHKRKGTPKLRTFTDGWRHVRFMLSHKTRRA